MTVNGTFTVWSDILDTLFHLYVFCWGDSVSLLLSLSCTCNGSVAPSQKTAPTVGSNNDSCNCGGTNNNNYNSIKCLMYTAYFITTDVVCMSFRLND